MPSNRDDYFARTQCMVWLSNKKLSLEQLPGQSKIAEPYLITFLFGIVDNKCDCILKELHVIDFLTVMNYLREASIVVARQLKIVSQIDAFMISATRNIQYVFKKLMCIIVL